MDKTTAPLDGSEPLDADIVKSILDALLPAKNRTDGEDYDDLLIDLLHFKIVTENDLRDLISGNLDRITELDRQHYLRSKENGYPGLPEARRNSGIFFNHVGLAREGLRVKFGENEVQAHFYMRDLD